MRLARLSSLSVLCLFPFFGGYGYLLLILQFGNSIPARCIQWWNSSTSVLEILRFDLWTTSPMARCGFSTLPITMKQRTFSKHHSPLAIAHWRRLEHFSKRSTTFRDAGRKDNHALNNEPCIQLHLHIPFLSLKFPRWRHSDQLTCLVTAALICQR